MLMRDPTPKPLLRRFPRGLDTIKAQPLKSRQRDLSDPRHFAGHLLRTARAPFHLGDAARRPEIARSELPAQRRDAEAVEGRCQRPQTLSGEPGDERADGEAVAVGEEGVVGGGDEVARGAF